MGRFDEISKEMILDVIKDKSIWDKNDYNIFILSNYKGKSVKRGIKINNKEKYSSVHIIKKVIKRNNLDIKGDINPDSCEPYIKKILKKSNNNNPSKQTSIDIEINPNIKNRILDNNVKYIIIGTFPPRNAYLKHANNISSEDENFSFYDSEKNLCWDIFHKLYENDSKYIEVCKNNAKKLRNNYNAKKEFLLSKNIGMVDIVEKTQRKKGKEHSFKDEDLMNCKIENQVRLLEEILIHNNKMKFLLSTGILNTFFKKPKKYPLANDFYKKNSKNFVLVPSFSNASGGNGDFSYDKYKEDGLKNKEFRKFLKNNNKLDDKAKKYLNRETKPPKELEIFLQVRIFEFQKIFFPSN